MGNRTQGTLGASLQYGEEKEPEHYVWGDDHTTEVNQFCEDITAWMKVVMLSAVVQDLCKDNNVSLSKVLEAHMTWKRKKCTDPQLGDFPAFEPVCKDIRLSVRRIGQEVHIGEKDPRSRSLTSAELVQICEVMLALVDPSCYLGEQRA
eukprot:308237-Amphidinium_carterae.2